MRLKDIFQPSLGTLIESYQTREDRIDSFSDYVQKLKESPQADWDNDCYFPDEDLAREMGLTDALEEFNRSGFFEDSTVIKTIKIPRNLALLHNPLKQGFYLGSCYKGKFKVIGKMMYKKASKIDALEIYKVIVHTKQRDKDFATLIYKGAMSQGFTLMSDSFQYKGAIKIWKRFFDDTEEWLSFVNDKKILVSLVNATTGETLSDDVRNATPKDIWSKDETKKEVRLVAKTI